MFTKKVFKLINGLGVSGTIGLKLCEEFPEACDEDGEESDFPYRTFPVSNWTIVPGEVGGSEIGRVNPVISPDNSIIGFEDFTHVVQDDSMNGTIVVTANNVFPSTTLDECSMWGVRIEVLSDMVLENLPDGVTLTINAIASLLDGTEIGSYNGEVAFDVGYGLMWDNAGFIQGGPIIHTLSGQALSGFSSVSTPATLTVAADVGLNNSGRVKIFADDQYTAPDVVRNSPTVMVEPAPMGTTLSLNLLYMIESDEILSQEVLSSLGSIAFKITAFELTDQCGIGEEDTPEL